MPASQEHRLHAKLPWMVLFAVLLVAGPSGCGGDDAVPATPGSSGNGSLATGSTDATSSGDGDSDFVALPPTSTTDARPSNGESPGSGSGSTDDLRLARDESAVARAEADAQDAKKFALSEYLAAVKKITRASFAEDGDDWTAAAREYRAAAKLYREAAGSARTAKLVTAEAEGLFAEYDSLRKEAESVGVAPSRLRELDRDRDEADAKLGRGAPETVRGAVRRAVDELRVAVTTARVRQAKKPAADALLAAVQTLKATAQSGEVDRWEAGTYERAMGELRAGESAHNREEYEKAVAHLERAREKLQKAMKATEERKLAGGSPPPIPGGDDDDGDDDDDAAADEYVDGGHGDDDSADPDVAVDEVAHIRERLLATLSGAPKYEDGILTLEYKSGFDFQEDCKLLPGTEANVQFDGPFRNNRWFDEEYPFAGHTRGHLLHEVVFENEVRIKLKVYFEFLVNNPQFQVGFMSDGSNFLSTNFGVDIYSWKKGKPRVRRRPSDKKYRANPNKWVLKGTQVSMEVRCTRPEGKGKMHVEVFYRGKKHSEWDTDKTTVGQVGFFWRDSRFMVTKLEITGRPSKEWLDSL